MLTNNENKLLRKVHASGSPTKVAVKSFLWAVMIVGMLGIIGCGSGGDSGSGSASVSDSTAAIVGASSPTPGTAANSDISPTQKWTLTNENGDVAYVIIVPFASQGTFTESCNSPGWWLRDANNNRTVRIPLNGVVTHSGQADTWDFTISELSGGARFTGLGTGSTTDGAYPAARNVQGTVSETATAPIGAVTVLRTWNWSGNNYSAWN